MAVGAGCLWHSGLCFGAECGGECGGTDDFVETSFPPSHTRVIDGTRLLGTDEELFQPGGMYPSDEGMAVVAENLYRQIIRRR